MLTQNWDAAHRLTEQTLSGRVNEADRLLQHRTYAYREDGYLTEIRELSSGTRRFDLDATGRVTGVRAHGWTETYAYDTTGNLTHATAPAHESAGERDFSGTLIRSAGRTSYEHDPQGRLIRKTHTLLNGQRHRWTYAWNAEDRLTEAVTPDGDCWRYAYDPLGRRISKHRRTADGSVAERTDFVWDDIRLAEQATPDGRVTTWDYAPGTHRPLTQTDHKPLPREQGASLLAKLTQDTATDFSTHFYAVITDGLGTPAELVTLDGELAWHRRTTLWGTSRPTATDTTAADCPLRFPGQYADSETGLNYNYFRYYDPETARYISPDPLGLKPAPNPNSYVRNPSTWSDPLGLAGCDLQDLGGGWYRSQEGLDYGPGSAEGHRITHVMQHTQENPAKANHGVFDTGSKGVLETVDEAWRRRATAVSVNEQGARTTYIIPMENQVGFNSGENYISITVEHGNEVITAFPRSWN